MSDLSTEGVEQLEPRPTSGTLARPRGTPQQAAHAIAASVLAQQARATGDRSYLEAAAQAAEHAGGVGNPVPLSAGDAEHLGLDPAYTGGQIAPPPMIPTQSVQAPANPLYAPVVEDTEEASAQAGTAQDETPDAAQAWVEEDDDIPVLDAPDEEPEAVAPAPVQQAPVEEYEGWVDEDDEDQEKLALRKENARLKRQYEQIRANPPKSRSALVAEARLHFPEAAPFLDMIPQDVSNREFKRQVQALATRARQVTGGAPPQDVAALAAENERLRQQAWGVSPGAVPVGAPAKSQGDVIRERKQRENAGLAGVFGNMVRTRRI